jgi:hypothetical protein
MGQVWRCRINQSFTSKQGSEGDQNRRRLMNLSDFQSRFESIGVCFDWRLFSHKQYSVQRKILTVPDDADFLFAPWYLDSKGKPVGYRHTEAHPVLISEAAFNAELERDQNIEPQFRGSTLPECPAIQVPQNKYLLLDGNHRVTAATKGQVRRPLILWVIIGPLNDELIPDLIHWK